jgi:ubiquinone/menaquinone biosynthesis C-methylase UbiE
MQPRHFIPPARFHSLTRCYDRLCRVLGLGEALRRFEIALLDPESPSRVLEVGCGTGELLRSLARRFPRAALTGLDPDPEALTLAGDKLRRDGLEARLVPGRAESLPFAVSSFDLVVSSLMIHHLPTTTKVQALRECRRVLDPGGTFLLVDFGPPRSWVARILLWPLRFPIFEEQADNLRGRLPAMLAEAGFSFEEVGVYRSVLTAFRARA